MIFRLYENAWNDIIQGLELRAMCLADDGHQDKATLVRELIKSLEELGKDVVGGTIDGYRLKAKIENTTKRLELRVIDEQLRS